MFRGICCAHPDTVQVFLIYAYTTFIGDGVRLFLTSKLTGASLLFYANCVIPLVTNAMALIGFVRMSDKVSFPSHFRGVTC